MVRAGFYSPKPRRKRPVIEDTVNGDGTGLDPACDDAVVEEEGDLELWDSRYMLRGDQHSADATFDQSKWGPRGWCKPSCIPISVILVLIVLVVLLPLLDQNGNHSRHAEWGISSHCQDPCRFMLVESLPEGIEYPPSTTPHPSTYQTWLNLIEMAEYSIEIASFYWTLRGSDIFQDPSAKQGEDIFQALETAGTIRNITLRIAQNFPTPSMPNLDTKELSQKGAAQVRSVNFPRLMGGGVLHTKFWIIDRKHIYVGSANLDWRALTQVKEVGAAVYNCSCIAADLGKIFDVYWYLGEPDSEIPGEWPDNLDTAYNALHPMSISFNDSDALTYIGSSPPAFCPDGRSTDLFTILNVIETAEKFIYVSVMDYFPLVIYSPQIKMWQDIDDALRIAAVNRKIEVRLLVSHWNSTRPSMDYFLRSLEAISGAYPGVHIKVKYFELTSTPSQAKIPFARVNHNKYMVTDNTAYIGTSNWSGDYFISTGGVGLVVKNNNTSPHTESSVRDQLEAVFERDWNSKYAHSFTSSG